MDRVYDVSALMEDCSAVKRGVKASSLEEAERKGRLLFPKAVVIIVEQRMEAWS